MFCDLALHNYLSWEWRMAQPSNLILLKHWAKIRGVQISASWGRCGMAGRLVRCLPAWWSSAVWGWQATDWGSIDRSACLRCHHATTEIDLYFKLGGEQVPGESAEFRYRTGTCTFRDQLSGTSARLSGTRQKSIRYRTGTWIFRDLFFRYQNRYLNFQVPIYQVPELEFR